MDEVFENDADPKPKKEKIIKKKRAVSPKTKERLRAQLKKGRATALANRKRKLAEKKSKKKSANIVTAPIKEEPVVVKEPSPKEEPKVEKPPSPKKEVVMNTPSPPKVKEEPMIAKTPTPAPRQISEPINIPPPLAYQSTFKKLKRKW